VVKKPNILELNGKRYDAYSGELLGSATGHAGRARSIDGFTTAAASHTLTPKPKAATPAKSVTPAPKPTTHKPISDFTRTPAHHVAHHKPANSQTLMRSAVHKPQPSVKRNLKTQQRTDVLVKQPSITVAPKLSSYQLDPKRVEHAKRVPRSPSVRRYAVDRTALTPQPVPVAVPTQTPPTTVQAQPAVRPVYADASAQTLRRPLAPQTHSTDIFEQALARANSHLQQPLSRRQAKAKRRKSLLAGRALSISAASLAVLLLVGFFAWQQKAALTMRYAASKSGVAATMPGYKPGGFNVGKFSYSPGVVAVNFTNNSNGSSFALVEKSTSWDSAALRDSFVASRSRTYQTIDAAGRTIYTYGNHNATWVDNNVWYQVNSQGSLTTRQLVNLAVSM